MLAPVAAPNPDVPRRPCVLVFAGVDPSGGAGVFADVQAIAAAGAHALAVVTVLTVQDQNRVYAVHAVPAAQVRAQAEVLIAGLSIAAVKIGIVGSHENAECIAGLLTRLKAINPDLPVVLDPVLASGHGDALTRENAVNVLAPLLAHAALITPNLPEAAALSKGLQSLDEQAAVLIAAGAQHVLIKGGHGQGNVVTNTWFSKEGRCHSWQWPRLRGEFHGSGCTLASAIAGRLACGVVIEQAIGQGQAFCQQSLEQAFAIGAGQRIPNRTLALMSGQSTSNLKEPT